MKHYIHGTWTKRGRKIEKRFKDYETAHMMDLDLELKGFSLKKASKRGRDVIRFIIRPR